jgi:hypothetical protein
MPPLLYLMNDKSQQLLLFATNILPYGDSLRQIAVREL